MRRRPPPLYRALAAMAGWAVFITTALTLWALFRSLNRAKQPVALKPAAANTGLTEL